MIFETGLVLFILLAAFAIRWDVLQANSFAIDSDEAIVGLMARHILQGQGVPIFYYGQHYMGSLEPLLVSLSFLVFGESNFALKLVPLVFSLVLTGLVYLVGRKIGGRWCAFLAALFFALGPSPLIVWSAKARGGFIELIVLGFVALLLTQKWFEKNRSSHFLAALIWLILGLGWWTNNQIIYFMGPIGLFMGASYLKLLWSARITVTKAFINGTLWIGAFFVGSSPFWFYNFNNDFASFSMFERASQAGVLFNLEGLATLALPILLGARVFWEKIEVFPGAIELLLLVYFPILFYLLFERRNQILDCFKLNFSSQNLPEMLLFFLFFSMGVFVVSSFGYLSQAPRYLLPLYGAIFPLAAYAIVKMAENFNFVGKMCALFLTLGVLVLNIFSTYPDNRNIPGHLIYSKDRVSDNHSELIAWLAQKDLRHIRTNYWIGYKLAFESAEQIRFIPFREPYTRRIADYQKEAILIGDENLPLVLGPAQAEIVKAALEVKGYNFKEVLLSGYVVIYSITPMYDPFSLKVFSNKMLNAISSHNSEEAAFAIDDDILTRWGSRSPQSKGMYFKILSDEPLEISAIRYHLGKWGHDYPRSLRIQAIREDGSKVELLGFEEYNRLLYYIEYRPVFTLYFKQPIKVNGLLLEQGGSHPIVDWSIAQVELFGLDQ